MDLNLDEQRLIVEFRKMSSSAKEELLAAATALNHRTGEKEHDGSTNQCPLKPQETRPEAEKTSIFTE
ncbi:hypothetical protein [Pelotalea chapellei]|uniref:Uncharacterized protein n=1 Tax=Pelotalea chapellei TaxID=44671 RepID=A0ABS5UC76_9BACT|nr:hypothetical protein [Pelotalea chapellei]MBT1073293.1 hypothetical protein [Pelotalea chapellei]